MMHPWPSPVISTFTGSFKPLPAQKEPAVPPVMQIEATEKRKRHSIEDGGDGKTVLLTLSAAMKHLSMPEAQKVFDIAARQNWGLEYHGGTARLRLPKEFLERRMANPTARTTSRERALMAS